MSQSQRDPAREQFWRQTMADWRASGRTIREFCRERQLARTTFQHWKRELKKRDQSQPAPRATKMPAFVPVTVIPSASLSVEVRCPTGHIFTLAGAEVSLRELFAAFDSATEGSSC